MDSSIFLAKFYGIVFVVAGLAILINGRSFNKIIKEYARHPQHVLFDGFWRLILGTFLVLYHNIWEASWVGLVTALGWMVLIKGILALLLPTDAFAKIIDRFNKNSFYVSGGVVLVVLGVYLAVKGFGIA